MCGVKAPFDTRGEAEGRVLALAGSTDLRWRAYQCPWCELWHLTTTVEGEGL